MVRNITEAPTTMARALHLFPDIRVYGAEHIHLGARVSFNNFCHLTATRDAWIAIGDDVLVGPFCVMNTGDHGFRQRDKRIREQACQRSFITIDCDVWIAAHVSIVRGAHIPAGCVIGANSVVTRHDELEPYCIYAGAPLRKIGERH